MRLFFKYNRLRAIKTANEPFPVLHMNGVSEHAVALTQ